MADMKAVRPRRRGLGKLNGMKHIENRIRGWLPKEHVMVHANNSSKPRWRKPTWIAFTLVVLVALAFATYTGVQTYLRYSNPQADVTASYFEKSLNCSTASVGDVVEVKVLVGWHGYVIPEFKREVKIIDPSPKAIFNSLVEATPMNTAVMEEATNSSTC